MNFIHFILFLCVFMASLLLQAHTNLAHHSWLSGTPRMTPCFESHRSSSPPSQHISSSSHLPSATDRPEMSQSEQSKAPGSGSSGAMATLPELLVPDLKISQDMQEKLLQNRGLEPDQGNAVKALLEEVATDTDCSLEVRVRPKRQNACIMFCATAFFIGCSFPSGRGAGASKNVARNLAMYELFEALLEKFCTSQ